MIEDKLALASMKQGWEDRTRYEAIMNIIREIKPGSESTLFLFRVEEMHHNLREYDSEIKRMEEIYGESFVEEYKNRRKEISLSIGEDRRW